MMHPMPPWNEIVQHKPMDEIFDKGPQDGAPDEKLRGGGHSERRDRQQNNCRQRREEYFSEIDDGGHDSSLDARSFGAQGCFEYCQPDPEPSSSDRVGIMSKV
jgi:hypothetical protein